MSSRALRKAQREREEQEQLRKLQQEQEEQQISEDDDEDDAPAAPRATSTANQSVFAMLDNEEPDEGEDDDDGVKIPESEHSDDEEEQAQAPAPKSAAKRKKKNKKKAKAGANNTTTTTPQQGDPSLDEIDLALKSLSTSQPGSAPAETSNRSDPTVNDLCQLLSIDSQHLHAANEMKRLFGRAALEVDDADDNAGARRRNRGGQQGGLAAAVGRRQGQAGRSTGLAALSLRRNIFIQGKEEWPQATGGGLAMEIAEKRPDGTVEYKYVHNRQYQDVQGQFEACVASMDPNRMVQLLQYNPYHISTLLQVSEIAKQERDHTTSGDLLERALFSFGRAVHSTFSTNLAQGKARLDFRRPENREFWLASSRYMANLGMRSTWRTVYEWSKLLLSLDPTNDPYSISLVIDQYALRGRQPQNFLDLTNNPLFTTKWKPLPNIQLSRALALINTNQAAKGKQTLYTAIARSPWVVARLFQELNLDPPPAIWGKTPRTDTEKLHTELYATRAKDLWNTPEASALLVEVSSALSSEVPEPPIVDTPITLDQSRHVLLTELPPLIALLPRSITAQITSSADPLPPKDDLKSYTPSSTSRSMQTRTADAAGAGGGRLGPAAENLRELQGLYRFFAELFPWFNPNGEERDEGQVAQPSEEEIERRIAESGVSEQIVVQRTQRLMELQAGLVMMGQQQERGAEDVDDELEEEDARPRMDS